MKIKPDFYLAWHNQGYALDDLGCKQQAIAADEEAMKIKLDFHLAWHNQGYALDDLGCKQQAIAAYKEAMKIKPRLLTYPDIPPESEL